MDYKWVNDTTVTNLLRASVVIFVLFVLGTRGVSFRAELIEHDAATSTANRDRREKGTFNLICVIRAVYRFHVRPYNFDNNFKICICSFKYKRKVLRMGSITLPPIDKITKS